MEVLVLAKNILIPKMNSVTTILNKTIGFNMLCRNYAFKSDLKIKWVRPEKIPCIMPQKSGDLKRKHEIDNSVLRYEFRHSKELETADETVRKLFTVEFGPENAKNKVYREQLIEKVKRHKEDTISIEVKIARWTGIIRAMQEHTDKLFRKKNRKRKIFLHELIDKRKKHLKYLRRWDYKRFEWLLDQLDLIYKPPPEKFHWITRKESLRKLTDKYCDKIKEEKLAEYRLQLEHEKPAFLEEKIRCLQFIREEEQKCGVEPTVTEEQIDDVKKQLEELQKSNKERQKESEE